LVGIKRVVPVISGLRAAHARSEKNSYALSIGILKIESRIADRLPCGHDGELTHAIEHPKLRGVEMLVAAEVYASRKRRNEPIAPWLINAANRGASGGGVSE
jgi:hypothetical protein